MGAVTLYHPISLHVIRGAAEYCGFQFGKLKQLNAMPELRCARYEATIQRVPPKLEDAAPDQLHAALNECFMDDIRVHWVHRTKSGVLACQIQVDIRDQLPDIDLPRDGDMRPDAEYLS